MPARLDHANLIVRDLDGMIQFLQTAFPDFRVRGGDTSPGGARWVHIGTHDTYIALSEATHDAPEPWVPYAGYPGMNHLAFEVGDAEAVRERLRAGGYQDTTIPNAHPARRRVYFHDGEGNDWEFVEYLTDDPNERHDYVLSDAP